MTNYERICQDKAFCAWLFEGLDSCGEWMDWLDTEQREVSDERTQEPLTWNERINQMTVEEKATLFQHDDCFIYKLTGTAYCDRHLGCEECTKQFLNSPYTEGATR